MTTPTIFKRFTALALLISLGSALLFLAPGRAQAGSTNTPTETTDKVSPDLRQLIRSGKGGTEVKVIVQYNSSSSPSSSGGLLGGLVGSLIQTVGGVVQGLLTSLNITLVKVPAHSVDVLASDPNVSYISLDTEVRSFGHVTTTTGAEQSRSQKNAIGLNYALDGSGVNIAVVDSGIDVNHKSFSGQTGRVVFSKDFTGENRTDDPYGHGTHVAAVAAGSGTATSGKYEGVASGSNLVNLRVLNSQGTGSVSGILKALDWIMANRDAYKIRVVNMSLGAPAISSYKDDPICQAVRKLSNAGVVVVAAAGNNGKTSAGQKVYGAIHSPGNEPSAITVGASNTYGSDARAEDSIATYSSRGPTRSFRTDTSGVKHYDNLVKPDLVAPGNKIISAEAVNNYLVK
jgi:subtilisin family serine protease